MAPPIQKQGKLKVFLMDVSALYPSIEKDMAKKAILESVKLSKLEWKNIDKVKLTRYVAMTVDSDKIIREELVDFVPKPKNTTTLNSFTNPSKITREARGENQFFPAARLPNKKEVEKLVGLAIGVGAAATMDNHFYRIDTQLRRQKCGGAIGSDATGECARLYMLSWDRKLKKKLKSLGIKTELYCRYVDDILCALDAINIGWDYDRDSGRMVYRQELLETDQRTDERRKTDILAKIANSLEPRI